ALRPDRVGRDGADHREAVERLLVAERMAAREDAACLSHLGGRAAEHCGDGLYRQRLRKSGHRQRDERSRAHREDVVEGVRGRDPGDLVARTLDIAARRGRPALTRVVNATGIVLHTNLGRAPLAPTAVARLGEVAGGYSNLEYDLRAGSRGSRHDHLAARLRDLTGAE